MRWRSAGNTQLKATWLWVYFTPSSNLLQYHRFVGNSHLLPSILFRFGMLSNQFSQWHKVSCMFVSLYLKCKPSPRYLYFISLVQISPSINRQLRHYHYFWPITTQRHDLIATPSRHGSIAAGLKRGKIEVDDKTNKHSVCCSAIYHAFSHLSIYSGALKS